MFGVRYYIHPRLAIAPPLNFGEKVGSGGSKTAGIMKNIKVGAKFELGEIFNLKNLNSIILTMQDQTHPL